MLDLSLINFFIFVLRIYGSLLKCTLQPTLENLSLKYPMWSSWLRNLKELLAGKEIFIILSSRKYVAYSITVKN